MKLENGMTAVVTGAGAGIGKDLAWYLGRKGINVALCDINEKNLLKVAEEISNKFGVKVSSHVVDISVRSQVKQFAKEVEDIYDGKVHLLFNNAGVASSAPFHELSEEDFDWCFNINVNGVISCTRAFLPMMIKQDKATIVNISSVAGIYPTALTGTAYTASKFAVRGFTETLLVEARAHYPHVNVLCVHPGIIQTDILDNARGVLTPELLTGKAILTDYSKDRAKKFYSAFGYTSKECVDMIMNSVIAGDTRALVGWDAVIMDWWIRLFPRIFASPFEPIVPLTAIVFRKAYFPLAFFAILYYFMRKSRRIRKS